MTAPRKQQGKVPSSGVAPLLDSFQERAAGEVDLHGLFVKEAIAYSKKAITDARRKGDNEIRLIVGMCVSSSRFEASSSVWCHGRCQAKVIILKEASLGSNLQYKRTCRREYS